MVRGLHLLFCADTKGFQGLSSQPIYEAHTAIKLIYYEKSETQRSEVTCLTSHDRPVLELEFKLWTG